MPTALNAARQRDFRFLLAAIGVSTVGSRITRTARRLLARLPNLR
jgi:hypothetical protein